MKLFMQIILWISISDMMANIPYTMHSRPSNGTPWCSISGFMSLYFYPASWLWTTMLVYFLYSLASVGKLPFTLELIHAICWGLPLLFTLLYLTTNTYGRKSDDPHFLVCSYGGDPRTGFIWHVITFYGLWFACVGIMMFMYWRIASVHNNKDNIILQRSMASLQMFPVLTILCWLPHMLGVCWIYSIEVNTDFEYFLMATDCLKIAHGMFSAMLFFYKSQEARTRWYRLFAKVLPAVGQEKSDSEFINDSVYVVEEDFSVEYGMESDVVNQLHAAAANGFNERGRNQSINSNINLSATAVAAAAAGGAGGAGADATEDKYSLRQSDAMDENQMPKGREYLKSVDMTTLHAKRSI